MRVILEDELVLFGQLGDCENPARREDKKVFTGMDGDVVDWTRKFDNAQNMLLRQRVNAKLEQKCNITTLNVSHMLFLPSWLQIGRNSELIPIWTHEGTKKILLCTFEDVQYSSSSGFCLLNCALTSPSPGSEIQSAS